jgi:hypothetical protein
LRKFRTAASFINCPTNGPAFYCRGIATPPPTFTATSPLPGGWRITAFEPQQRLTLTRGGKLEMKDALRRLFVVLAATAMILFLISGSSQEGGHFRPIVAPVVLLLLVVVFFGLLALLRSAMRAAARVHLAVDKAAGLISGFTAHRTLARLRIEPLSTLDTIELDVRRGAGSNPRDPRSWATLELKLTDGTRLEAPEAWGPDDAYDATERLLMPLAEELARLSGRPLKVTHMWTGESRTVTP